MLSFLKSCPAAAGACSSAAAAAAAAATAASLGTPTVLTLQSIRAHQTRALCRFGLYYFAFNGVRG